LFFIGAASGGRGTNFVFAKQIEKKGGTPPRGLKKGCGNGGNDGNDGN
jgi:hypothetical protein